jgi:hypothetical protein
MARMRITLVAAAATIAALAAPTTASAERVTDCDDLQQTIDDFAVVTIAEGLTCEGSFELPDGRVTDLAGEGAGATLSGSTEEGRVQILRGFNLGTSRISNLTFVQGDADGDNGGAIQFEGDSPVTLEGNRFFANDANDDEGGGAGGAVSLELDNQVLQPNEARLELPPVVLRDNTFGEDDGGNDADREGGAVSISAFFRHVIVEGNSFVDNDSDAEGGGLALIAGQATLSDNTFQGNEGQDGGGAAVGTCLADITGNTFDGNEASASESDVWGGGLYLEGQFCRGAGLQARGGDGGNVTQSGNRFVGNRVTGGFSDGEGAGEFVRLLSLESTDDSFVGNAIVDTRSGRGGGLAFAGSGRSFAARNLVAVGNSISPSLPPASGLPTLDSEGGGLSLRGSTLSVEDATITGNSAGVGGGIAGFRQQDDLERGAANSDVLTLHNSIVFGNENGAGEDVAGFLDRDVRSSDTCVEGAAHPGDGNVCVAPQLTAPDDDGDVDQTAGSPTIDAGDSALVDGDLASDYAGDGRIVGARVDMGADEYVPPTTEPETPAQPQPPAPAPAGAVQGVQQRSCVSRRSFRIRIRVPKGKKAISATVRVNGKKVRVVRGKRLRAAVRLRGLPKGRFSVRITVRLANGKRITGVRRYHTCIPKRPGDGPPKV